jgi:manganese/zinc/iron transport system substrate-binding protein
MDVALWSELVPILEAELARLDPADAAGYRERAQAYRAELAALERYVRRVLATVPPERRVLVTAHDAFGYFGRAYGFEVHGIQGLSTESEAGLAEIERLVRLIVERRIGAVFVESSVAERNVRALVEGAAARGHEVRIGGQLFSDAMGAPGTYEGTYVGMIDHNVTVIARALGGEAPPRGMNGRLATVG